MIKTAIVILNWNGIEFLKKFIPIVVEESQNHENKVIVADNGSTDASVQWLKTNHPEVSLILLNKNYGFTGGYNRALKEIEATYFILLNSDIEVSKNWLNPLIQIMESDQKIAACMPKIKAFNQKNSFEYAGAAGGFIDKYGYPFCRGRILNELESDLGQYNKPTEIFWASGACMMIRADLYKQSGGLDDDFFAHMEEIDLCWRLKNEGYKIVFQPESTVFHVGGGTLPNNSPQKIYLNYRNNLFLLYKNLNSNELSRTLFIRMVLDGSSAFMYLLQGRLNFFFAVFKAHIHFYKMLGEMREKRNRIQHKKRIKEINEVYKSSIVFDFFIRNKKKFQHLSF